MRLADDLERLADLKAKGVLSEQEFDGEKAKLLSVNERSAPGTSSNEAKLSLWNPIPIILISGFVFPAFGFVLLGANWQELGNKKYARSCFAVASIIVLKAGSLLIKGLADKPPPLDQTILIWTWVFLAATVLIGAKQFFFIKKNYPSGYTKKSMWLPALIAVVFSISLLIALVSLYGDDTDAATETNASTAPAASKQAAPLAGPQVNQAEPIATLVGKSISEACAADPTLVSQLAATAAAARELDWVKDVCGGGVQAQGVTRKIAGTNYVLFTKCEPHNCGGAIEYIIYDGRAAYALLAFNDFSKKNDGFEDLEGGGIWLTREPNAGYTVAAELVTPPRH